MNALIKTGLLALTLTVSTGAQAVTSMLLSCGGNDPFTKSLLQLQGANNSTTFTDTAAGAGTPLVWSQGGGAKLSTTTVKFGVSSLLLNGTTDYITTPSNALFNNLGTTPFVFDTWINTANSGSRMGVAGVINAAGANISQSFLLQRDAANTVTFLLASGVSTSFSQTTAGTITGAGWHHVAGIATGTTMYVALDGIVSAGTAYSGLNATTNQLSIGRFGELTTLLFNGSIASPRLTVGTTRGWTSNFTPPNRPYCQ